MGSVSEHNADRTLVTPEASGRFSGQPAEPAYGLPAPDVAAPGLYVPEAGLAHPLAVSGTDERGRLSQPRRFSRREILGMAGRVVGYAGAAMAVTALGGCGYDYSKEGPVETRTPEDETRGNYDTTLLASFEESRDILTEIGAGLNNTVHWRLAGPLMNSAFYGNLPAWCQRSGQPNHDLQLSMVVEHGTQGPMATVLKRAYNDGAWSSVEQVYVLGTDNQALRLLGVPPAERADFFGAFQNLVLTALVSKSRTEGGTTHSITADKIVFGGDYSGLRLDGSEVQPGNGSELDAENAAQRQLLAKLG